MYSVPWAQILEKLPVETFEFGKGTKSGFVPPFSPYEVLVNPKLGGVWVKVGFWKHSLLKVIQFLLMQFAWKLKAYFWDFSKDRAWVWGLRGQRLLEGLKDRRQPVTGCRPTLPLFCWINYSGPACLLYRLGILLTSPLPLQQIALFYNLRISSFVFVYFSSNICVISDQT